MNPKLIGLVLLSLGIVGAGLAATADFIGLGNPNEFGMRQMLGIAVGAIAALIGVVLVARKPATGR